MAAENSFDVVSEVDLQEVRNAVDQVARELATRFDFKGTGASIELGDHQLTLAGPTEDRLAAIRQVLDPALEAFEAECPQPQEELVCS